jgi:predicted acylesterase/phospholipase RssA
MGEVNMPIKNIAIGCQGGGSHAAYAAGALPALLRKFENAEIAKSDESRKALEEGSHEAFNLSGISGTSGGAISALLAWYGFLTGGPEVAKSRLEKFWDANCAHEPGELVLNNMVQSLGNMLQVDLKFSPYLFPLREIEQFATCTWPMMTRLWPPLGTWIRPNYFQLRESVEPHVDFDLVAAIGDFCSIPLEIKRWQACALELRMFDPVAPRQAHIRKKQVEIEDGIRARLESARWIAIWMQQHDLPANSLLRTIFDGWTEPDFTFEPTSLDRLAQAVNGASYAIPQLLIGAVDIDSGAFVAFSSERAPDDAGITLDAVVASASLPWVFPAQPVHGTDPETHDRRTLPCWDGLFSQNPPIKNFVSTEINRSKKPDGLWILQINQDRFDFSRRIAEARGNARSGEELWHRRDTLSGNLSLNQEVAFIEAVNQRLDDPGQRFRPYDKPIEVVRIVMDAEAVGAAAGKELGLFSKFDRNPALEQALLAHGRDQARNYLTLLRDGANLWDGLAHALEAMGARPSPRFEKALPWLPGRRRIFGGMVSPDVITFDREPAAVPAGVPQAAVRWHVSDAVMDGRTVSLKGSTALWADDAGWHLGETRLLDVEEKKLEPRKQPVPVQPQPPIQLSWPRDIFASDRPGHGATGRAPQ